MDVFARSRPKAKPTRKETAAMAADSLATILGVGLPGFLGTGRDEVLRAMRRYWVGHAFQEDDFIFAYKRLCRLATNQLNASMVNNSRSPN